MKIIILSFLINFNLFANNIENYIGSFELSCTQTQKDFKSGYITQNYTFNEDHSFSNTILWYSDSNCLGAPNDIEIEKGIIQIGEENLNNGFNPKNTFNVIYTTELGTDYGLIYTNDAKSYIRLSRGLGNMQNSMLGIFRYMRR